MTREEKIAVVESYIHNLGNGDLSRVPFAEEVALWSPLTPRRTGQDATSSSASSTASSRRSIPTVLKDAIDTW